MKEQNEIMMIIKKEVPIALLFYFLL